MTEMILNFKKEVPKAPGSYLIHWKRGVYEVIDVIRDDIRHYGGMEFGGELLVTSWGGKNVNRIYMPLVNGIATLPDIEP